MVVLEKQFTLKTRILFGWNGFGTMHSGKSDEYKIMAFDWNLNEYGEDALFLLAEMELDNDKNMLGHLYPSGLYEEDSINFKIDGQGNIEYECPGNKEKAKMLNVLEKNPTIATHFGDDLDNKSSIYAIENYLRELGLLKNEENLKVERVPAGQIKEGALNVDTGGHKGNRFDDETIVIDGDPANGVKSASESLSKMGVYVPEQIVELADSMPKKVNPLDSRSGLALVRYLSGNQAFRLAQANLLDKSLTDEQLERYGLTDAHKKQQQIIDTAVDKINQYTTELPNGEKIVLAPERIAAGSIIAYEKGINYYASASDHINEKGEIDGVTFAVTSKPGVKLPENVIKYGNELSEKYRIDEKSSGVFVNPNGQMIVAGGPKNPNFKIEGKTKESMLNQVKDVFSEKELSNEYSNSSHNVNEISSAISDRKSSDINKTFNEINEIIQNKDKDKEDERTTEEK